jgi:hypothetical protein
MSVRGIVFLWLILGAIFAFAGLTVKFSIGRWLVGGTVLAARSGFIDLDGHFRWLLTGGCRGRPVACPGGWLPALIFRHGGIEGIGTFSAWLTAG